MNKHLLTALLTLLPAFSQAFTYAPVDFKLDENVINSSEPHIVKLVVWRYEIVPNPKSMTEIGLSKQHKVQPNGKACMDDMVVKAAEAQFKFIKELQERDERLEDILGERVEASYEIIVECVPVKKLGE